MGNMFPPDWEVSERIAVEFCDITRNDIEKLMFKRKHELDTKLLLFAIQKTVNFESLLSRRFTGITLEQHKQDLQEKKEKESKVRLILQPALDILSVGFNPRLLLIMLYFHYR